MNDELTKEPQVAIIKNEDIKTALIEGIEKLGGITQFVEEGDSIFINTPMLLILGNPNCSHMDLLTELIKLFKENGANKVYIGAFPKTRVSTALIDKFTSLSTYLNSLGAEFVFLDNSDVYEKDSFNEEKIRKIKQATYSEIEIEGRDYKVPKLLLESDKYVILNQIKVDPIFTCTLSMECNELLAEYGLKKEMEEDSNEGIYKELDVLDKKVISRLIDINMIRTPDLVINDMYEILDLAGPLYYYDSNIINQKTLVLGTDSISTDIITLRILDQNIFENILIVNARERNLGPKDLSQINNIGESIESSMINLSGCKDLNDLKLLNTQIRTGDMCLRCKKAAYHCLNYLSSQASKDLKYSPVNSLLIGKNPPEPLYKIDLILFGDCAIKTTQNNDFRTIKGKTLVRRKEKDKKNKKILEIEGCPPNFFNFLSQYMKYFGKASCPNLNYFFKLLKVNNYSKYQKNLNKWEQL